MTHEEILWKILEVFRKCDVRSFPINCFELLKHYGYECQEYSELEPNKQEVCYQVSEDAFRLQDKVYYNDNAKFCRRRFSLMHELGHIVLNHQAPYTQKNEQEANFFAGNILAPRMAIHYARCKNPNDVAELFRLTYEAASYAFDDYRRWRRKAIYRMTAYDKAMYQHFYDDKEKCFVWSVRKCQRCHATLYNTTKTICNVCKIYRKPGMDYMIFPVTFLPPKQRSDFLVAEQSWLYGDDL